MNPIQDENIALIIGKLTRDPDFRFTAQGTRWGILQVSTARKYKHKEEWHEEVNQIEVKVWGKLVELLDDAEAGTRVKVKGRIQTRYNEEQGRWYMNGVTAEKLEIMGSNYTSNANEVAESVIDIDSLPF